MTKLTIGVLEELQQLVHTQIKEIARKKDGPIRIGIPGGRSVRFLIQGMLDLDDATFRRIRLYLLDERLSGELNYDMLLEAGLGKAIKDNRFVKTNLHIPSIGKSLLEQEKVQLDLVYLGVGEDGHIASLFPGSYPSMDKSQTSLVKDSPKLPKERVTFTYWGFLKHAHKTPIYLLFLGEGKREALSRLLENKEKTASLPCSFFSQQDFPVTIITDIKE